MGIPLLLSPWSLQPLSPTPSDKPPRPKVNELRRDLSAYKARIEDLQKDFMRLDVGSRLGEAEAGGDDKLKKAWETASMFKKRCA